MKTEKISLATRLAIRRGNLVDWAPDIDERYKTRLMNLAAAKAE